MAKATKKRPASKSNDLSKATTSLDRPVKLGNPRMGWVSDAVAEVTRKLNFKYMALVPAPATAVFTIRS